MGNQITMLKIQEEKKHENFEDIATAPLMISNLLSINDIPGQQNSVEAEKEGYVYRKSKTRS